MEAREDELRAYLRGSAVLDQIIASGSSLALREHLDRPRQIGRAAGIARLMDGFDCETGVLTASALGDLGIGLIPNGRRGSVYALVSATVILAACGSVTNY